MKQIVLCLALCAALLVPTPARAYVYLCVDEIGTPHVVNFVADACLESELPLWRFTLPAPRTYCDLQWGTMAHAFAPDPNDRILPRPLLPEPTTVSLQPATYIIRIDGLFDTPVRRLAMWLLYSVLMVAIGAFAVDRLRYKPRP